MVSCGEGSRRKSRCEGREPAVCLVGTQEQAGGRRGSRMRWGVISGGEVPRKAGVPIGHGGRCDIWSRAMPGSGLRFKGILAATFRINLAGGRGGRQTGQD